MSDTSEKLLGDYEIGVGNSDCKGHNVVKVVSLDVAVAVEIAAEDEIEMGEVGGKLHKKVLEPFDGSVTGDNRE